MGCNNQRMENRMVRKIAKMEMMYHGPQVQVNPSYSQWGWGNCNNNISQASAPVPAPAATVKLAREDNNIMTKQERQAQKIEKKQMRLKMLTEKKQAMIERLTAKLEMRRAAPNHKFPNWEARIQEKLERKKACFDRKITNVQCKIAEIQSRATPVETIAPSKVVVGEPQQQPQQPQQQPQQQSQQQPQQQPQQHGHGHGHGRWFESRVEKRINDMVEEHQAGDIIPINDVKQRIIEMRMAKMQELINQNFAKLTLKSTDHYQVMDNGDIKVLPRPTPTVSASQ
ncbi:hypothetical protein SAMD00019534_090270 [Acytostelium subglobosum LB1]|uniref:hypothetical protein n=1 Tax=Acytostelium subglobosum LB1 TaxID=1410327 RepID=UPI0006447F3E|nr:hypothetical protein SAMD00019534_090270 [Acytostelium subglobosum LB1]GAM25852.1 hypothetical protein SAMD00019534_090270 [Acytostelium subglobosum LB1]|eukprot:XP_012751370.1 hypothetical protein SAMD00019534_090270 [Acytostelium subglobosum LB1]